MEQQSKRREAELDEMRRDIALLQKALANAGESVTIGGREYSRDEARADLQQRQSQLKATVDRQSQALADIEARKTALARWRDKLDRLISLQRALRVSAQRQHESDLENEIDALLRRLESLELE